MNLLDSEFGSKTIANSDILLARGINGTYNNPCWTFATLLVFVVFAHYVSCLSPCSNFAPSHHPFMSVREGKIVGIYLVEPGLPSLTWVLVLRLLFRALRS